MSFVFLDFFIVLLDTNDISSVVDFCDPKSYSELMRDYRILFLLLEFAVCFYNVGTIWAHEVDIFRTWKLVNVKDFHNVQRVHWRKLPYWIFTPVGLAMLGSIVLIWYYPAGSPIWAIWGNVICQVLSGILTALFWGRWQAKLSQDALGPDSPYLTKILKTHWVRTFLINASAFIVLLWAIQLFTSH